MNTVYYGTETNIFFRDCESEKPECLIIIPDADPKTFRMVVHSGSVTPGIGSFAKDAKHVYGGHRILPLADPKTFTTIDASFAKDKRHVYYNGHLLRGINARKFKKLNVFYATDGKKVIYMNKPLRGADAFSFKVMSEKPRETGISWGYDYSNVFYQDKKVNGLNPR